MSPEFKTRLSRLHDLVGAGLCLGHLDKLTQQCNDLNQDGKFPLTFFVLKSVFRELASLIDANQPVSEEDFISLTKDVQIQMLCILEEMLHTGQTQPDALEKLVWVHLTSMASFRVRKQLYP